MTVPRIELKHVSKTYNGGSRPVPVLHDVSFSVMPGEFVTIIGPSGSGKSTLFNLCAGLLAPDNGEIYLDGTKPEKRTGLLGYMPQRDLLLPWRSVLDNVLLPLEIQGVPKAESREQAREMLVRFGLGSFENDYPAVLSGGMRQRAALLRTWLTGRSTMLLDEPFGALDALTRKELRDWLLTVWHEYERTVLFITHDIEEAVYLADRVIVLGPHSGTIKTEVAVDLPRPRRPKDIADPRFGRLMGILLDSLEEESPATS